MNEGRVRFPEYGDGGDYVGARRGRRAFRFFVVGVALFVLVLAYAELYLQQDGAERLYTHALTLQDESARVLLRQAVLHDKQAHEVPTPKYLEALASREEAGKVLDTYEEAFKLDGKNPVLAMRYGCQLLREGRNEEASGKFAAAAASDPSNALPLYLKAAALPATRLSQEALSESLALIAQANTGGRRVSFPLPLWSSMLPTRGRVYALLCRQAVDECSGPLYSYVNTVVRLARKDIESGQTQNWDAWLQTLQVMGEHIASAAGAPRKDNEAPAAGGALQALLGIRIQRAAIEQRLVLIQMRGAPPNEALATLARKLEQAQRPLLDFENARDARIAANRRGYLLPATLFCEAFLGALLAYLISRAAWNRYGRRIVVNTAQSIEGEEPVRGGLPESGKEPERTVRHGIVAKAIMTGGSVLLLTTLFVLILLQRNGGDSAEWIPTLSAAWLGQLLVLTVFGLVYPLLALPSARKASLNHAGSLEHGEEMLRVASLRRRRAVFCITYRYYAILLGLVVVVFAAWTIGYRVILDLYPWQTPLLTTGLIDEEQTAVNDAINSLL